MIMVFAGTKEGMQIIETCLNKGLPVMALAVTDYGSEMASSYGVQCIQMKEVSASTVEGILEKQRVNLMIDAGHPHSSEVSTLLASCCEHLDINYCKLRRQQSNLPDSKLIYPVASMSDAAEMACDLGKTVFLTTGSYELEVFLKAKEKWGNRLIVRVLPQHSILKKCQDMGFKTKDLVAVQGPFSTKFNREMFKFFKTDVVVTKESGKASGTDTKVAAALQLNIPVVVVERKKGDTLHGYTVEEIVDRL